ncbi:glycosyltransferase [Phaeovulum vinaykumarii]|uniref:Glycosyltransferase, catalytic subunit of cellulose synthase and poly-beta-1,6-N-acetylglucosamine synthase n=1 Tax=Phaeovulum vinaykumarii TaxID=407234 RepID=A0A1N7L5Y8_9RHOB|nr:glycosyltransferase [Phaeovulum vinaykumarii]SIS69213.1 Glycosyltransferase, catalytic subunit of cellulose synthase and poly-beta-1,6-N-acetylglucosamine synthase [Phaeovulum vinaykumarii]SOB99599.1 cellulose synthase/poly-beta-1,6-N-acetylglucosamine synthase-like glycosyltransferase [Phaeovulum vinaykumarii]
MSVIVPIDGARKRAAARPRVARAPAGGRKPLGQILVEMQAVSPGNLLKALAMRDRQGTRLGEILRAHGWVSEADLMRALAQQWNAAVVDLAAEPPDPRLIDRLGAKTCLVNGMVPWKRVGDALLIATSRPEEFVRLRHELPAELGPFRMVLAGERAIHDALLARRQTALIRAAETCVAAEDSCRIHAEDRVSQWALIGLGALALGLLIAPLWVFGALMAVTVGSLVLSTALKAAALIAEIRGRARAARRAQPERPLIARLPIVSIMVPLFREDDIAGRLVKRLERLEYPREAMDILLVVEESDALTRAALARARLPQWMRVIVVPDGPIRTKPRALNFALNFCRGSIVGVYDAEDAPEPDQIHKIVRRFHERGPEVACLQGILDFYNPRTNFLARAFTIEYAAWFRAMLPGLARLGLVVPLGGTTLFFRRAALEALGGWDAHNVTEDADLGVRLARRGYRTELVDTVTHEEANCRALPWVKQRSRWLKGYAMTWGVHMRRPGQLWRELGPWRFLGFQVLFLGALAQYLLAPLLWTLWLMAAGLWHPISALAAPEALMALVALSIGCEALSMTLSAWAVRGPRHRHLLPWVPFLSLYFPLGTFAAWKGLYEVITRPFYWDKTSHGIYDAGHEDGAETGTDPAPPPAPRLPPHDGGPGRGAPQLCPIPVHQVAAVACPRRETAL